jgi:hypothetical protein
MTTSGVDVRELNEIRHGLLTLHKTLLDTQRLWYEKEHGRLEGGGQMLQLLAYDPAFAWLRLFSALIVEIDEKLDDKDNPMTADAATRLVAEARGLVVGKDGGDEFQQSYNRALQERPEAVIAQSRLARLLSSRK